MLGCLGKVPPNRSQGHVTDYIIQQNVNLFVNILPGPNLFSTPLCTRMGHFEVETQRELLMNLALIMMGFWQRQGR
jgi:hypothetical protein